MTIYAKQNVIQPLIVAVIDNNGNYITGLTVTFEVRKSSDNSLYASGTLTSVGNIYINNVTMTTLDKYYVLYITPSGYENGEEELVVDTATLTDLNTQLNNLAISIAKILGLSQSNYRLTDQVYNPDGCLVMAKISIYPTQVDTENQTNPIAEYEIEAVYNLAGQLIDYKVVEI